MFFLLLLTVLVLTLAGEDYYQILGIKRDADEKSIKKAFKKLTLKHHPDKNLENKQEAEETFMRIANAYDVLSNPKQKKVYDKYGEEGLKDSSGRGGQRRGGGGFNDFFGGGFRFNFNQGRHHQEHHEEKTPSFFAQTDVFELDFEGLNSLFRRNEVWMVLFYSPRTNLAKEMKETWVELADKLYGMVKVAAVNCHEEEELCEEYGAQRHLTIVYFPQNTAKTHQAYTGPRTYKDLSDFAVSKMQSFVQLVHEGNVEDFLGIDLPKIVLFTDKKNTPPMLKALSKQFKGRLLVGEARDSDLAVCSRFGVRSFPSLLAPSEHPDTYAGELKLISIEKWVRGVISSYRAPVGTVKELSKSVYFSGKCTASDPKFCFLGFIERDDSATKEMLKNLAKQFETDPIDFYWVDAAEFSAFAEEFSSKFVVYKAKKKKYVRAECPDEQCLGDIVGNVLSGGSEYIQLDVRPEFRGRKTDL